MATIVTNTKITVQLGIESHKTQIIIIVILILIGIVVGI